MECIATFNRTHHALLFEKEIKKIVNEVKIVPVPRELSNSCGFAARFPCSEKQKIENICKEKGIEVAGYHEISTPSARDLKQKETTL